MPLSFFVCFPFFFLSFSLSLFFYYSFFLLLSFYLIYSLSLNVLFLHYFRSYFLSVWLSVCLSFFLSCCIFYFIVTFYFFYLFICLFLFFSSLLLSYLFIHIVVCLFFFTNISFFFFFLLMYLFPSDNNDVSFSWLCSDTRKCFLPSQTRGSANSWRSAFKTNLEDLFLPWSCQWCADDTLFIYKFFLYRNFSTHMRSKMSTRTPTL